MIPDGRFDGLWGDGGFDKDESVPESDPVWFAHRAYSPRRPWKPCAKRDHPGPSSVAAALVELSTQLGDTGGSPTDSSTKSRYGL